jgi:hypothetical protein
MKYGGPIGNIVQELEQENSEFDRENELRNEEENVF